MEETLLTIDDTAKLKDAREQLTQIISGSSFTPRDRALIVLAADEALAVLVESANGQGKNRGGGHEINLKVSLDDSRVRIHVHDPLNDFEARDLSVEDIREMAQSQINPLGVFLIRQIMDEVTYKYKKGFENEIIMIKFTPAEA